MAGAIIEEEEDMLDDAFSMLDEDGVPPSKRTNAGEDGPGKRRAMGAVAEDEDEEDEFEAEDEEMDEGSLREAASSCSQEYGANSEEALAALQQLAMLLVGQANWAAAQEVIKDMLERAEEGLGLTHETTLQALGTYAGVQWQLEEWEGAQHSLTKLLGVREKGLAEAEAAWKNRDEGAAAMLQDGQELAAEASVELASIHVEFGDHELAIPLYRWSCGWKRPLGRC